MGLTLKFDIPMHNRHRPPSRTSASMQPPHHPTQFPYYPPHCALARPHVPYVRVDEVEEAASWDVGQHEGLQWRPGKEVQEGLDGGVRYVPPTAIKMQGRANAQHLCPPLQSVAPSRAGRL